MEPLEHTDALRETLQFLMVSDIPAHHKRILIEAVTQALKADAAADRHIEALQKTDAAEWQPHETKIIEAFLQGKVARNWQHADEILMRLAAQLHRNPVNVRAKATELGFGVGVDYRLAKAQGSTARE